MLRPAQPSSSCGAPVGALFNPGHLPQVLEGSWTVAVIREEGLCFLSPDTSDTAPVYPGLHISFHLALPLDLCIQSDTPGDVVTQVLVGSCQTHSKALAILHPLAHARTFWTW